MFALVFRVVFGRRRRRRRRRGVARAYRLAGLDSPHELGSMPAQGQHRFSTSEAAPGHDGAHPGPCETGVYSVQGHGPLPVQ